MSEKIEPALTPEEWGIVADALDERRAHADQAADQGSEEGTDALHRLEAVIDSIRAGKPFGFTREDVDALRRAVILERWEAVVDHDETAKLEHLAGRIAALLPPREDHKP